MSRPATATTPALGRSRPPRICSSVVLPDPEAPTIATRSPIVTERLTPSSTCSSVGPWRKLLCTSRALSTVSFMSQRLRGGGAPRPPRRVDGRQSTQEKCHAAHLEHVETLHVRRQVAHVVDPRVEKLGTEEALEPGDQSLQVVRQQGPQGGAAERA